MKLFSDTQQQIVFFPHIFYNTCMLKFISVLDICFLLLFSTFMWIHDPIAFNFTGLLNQSQTRIYAILLCVYFTVLLLFHLYHLKKKQNCFILFLLICLTTLIPYSNTGNLFSQLHLLFALATLVYLNVILYTFYWYSKKITTFYLCCCVLSCGFVLTYSAITGISEWIYVIGLILSLHFLDHSYKK